MQFCLDKSAKVTFNKGSQVKSTNITLDINTELSELEGDKAYKY